MRYLLQTLPVHMSLKAGLHYSDYRSKLEHFEGQKNIFYVLKSPSLERFLP
jgi:hypothetical protein